MAGKKGRSGRKPKSLNRSNAIGILAETSPHAAGYLRTVAKGELGTYEKVTMKKSGDVITEILPMSADPVRVDTCKYVINQDLGMPRQRQEVTATQKIDMTVRELTDEELGVIAAERIIANACRSSTGTAATADSKA